MTRDLKNQDFGMVSMTADDCIFAMKDDSTGSVLVIAIVVDDVLMIGNNEALRQCWFQFMRGFFEVSDDGDLHHYLGVRFTRENGDLVARQDSYLKRVLDRFRMRDCKPAPSPMAAGFKIDPDSLPEHGTSEDVEEMRAIIGCLMYLQVWTRPEIAYAVNYLARFTLRADKVTLKAARRVLAYCKGTPLHGIRYKFDPDNQISANSLKVYADTSDADCKLTSKSTGGFIITLNGAPIAWRSGRLPLVTLSSAESEYVQLTLACQEILYLREVLQLLGFEQASTEIFEDNQAAIAICYNPCHRSRTRHIKRRYHFIRQCIKESEVFVTYTRSEDNIADLFTKPLGDTLFKRHADRARNYYTSFQRLQ
jgi:hypothetical protein